MTDGKRLLEAYLNGEPLGEDRLAELSAWVCASKDNAREAAVLMHLNAVIRSTMRSRAAAPLAGLDGDRAWDQTLSELAEQEQSAEVQIIALDGHKRAAGPDPREQALSPNELATVGGYLFRRALSSRARATGLAAAVLALCVTLFLVFLVFLAGPGPGPETAGVNPPPGSSVPVAKLTAERDARWEHPPGEDLYAGQRFTLTQGFAEITTQRGAVVILEAPCTVELIDHDNALRLVSGKLVSICETDSSKGFLVRAPHVDITDLGTRFGVDATSPSLTQVYVLKGLVEVSLLTASPQGGDQSQRLTAGNAVAADPELGLVEIDEDTKRFEAFSTARVPLPGTGVGRALGEPDPDWRIVAIGGRGLDEPIIPIVWWEIGIAEAGGAPNDPEASQWIGLVPEAQSNPEVAYVFECEIQLPDTDAVYRLDLDLAVDNVLTAIRVNGAEVATPKRGLQDFNLRRLVIDRHLRGGSNTIQLEITNHKILTHPGPVGLRLQWQALEIRK